MYKKEEGRYANLVLKVLFNTWHVRKQNVVVNQILSDHRSRGLALCKVLMRSRCMKAASGGSGAADGRTILQCSHYVRCSLSKQNRSGLVGHVH